ncbi:MAG: hypothetical protein [Caudoviricetes sp.]|nr:MAG: hypothetical protein [Caudoviricetes sp.]
MNLTQEQFSKLTGNSEISEEEVAKLLPKAQLAVDEMTNGFYDRFSFEDDEKSAFAPEQKRASAYKQSIALTIEFMVANDVQTSAELNSNGKAQLTIGRTHVQGYDLSGVNISGTVIPDEAYSLLARNGLLYRGGY